MIDARAVDPARVPVIVGVGQVEDREPDPFAARDSLGLMVDALHAADADAGGGWLAEVDSLDVVDQISFRDLNPLVDPLAAALGMSPARRAQTAMPMGDSPVRLLNEAANRIGAGETRVAAIVGAEALRTAARRAAARAGGGEADHNAMRARHRDRAPDYRQRYGLVAPVDIYPLYENATRSAWGQSLAQAQAESAAIWADFSVVAAANPHAWLRTPRTAAEIATPTADNRRIAFPYAKLMVANSSVNQGAGFLVTSLAHARARGIPDARLVHVGHGAAAHEPDDILARDGYAASAGMRVSLEATLRLNALEIADVDHVELYSCFPCVPKMARRVIGWPLARAMSVVGGLTFGGGPIGNYMSHAIAAMVDRLRGDGATRAQAVGLLFGNGGVATHNHSIVLSAAALPGTRFPRQTDYQAQADALRAAAPRVDPDYDGDGIVETYTLFYDRTGAPRAGVVVALNPAGCRFLARVQAGDAATIAFLTDGVADPIGTRGIARRAADGLVDWTIGAA
ncbi:acetyl-CoA acetyltransferase [Sphingomonas oligophenolica]|uniref:Acetyl-CoA acetyltransferase n=2 Tax=Sphingomonas oligophenolica TaxID=301154 RepID=A0A502CK85_9SPHN|nr:acetyl-CoA acetyltransferase [Sphingomonas oligophenolica]